MYTTGLVLVNSLLEFSWRHLPTHPVFLQEVSKSAIVGLDFF